MKKIYNSLSILAFVALSGSVMAQAPTITAAMLPQVGFTYNDASDTTAADLPSFTVTAGSGTAQTWNYSTQFANIYGESTAFVAPSTGSGNSNFPSANLAINQAGNWAYIIANASGLVIDGVYAVITGTTSAAINYTPNEIILPTPFTLNGTVNNIYSATFTTTSNGQTIQIRHHANRTITADAYGSLTTPTATYPSTLRTKTFEGTIDSIFVSILGNWSFIQYQTDSTTTYNWWQNSQDLNLMEIDLNKANAVTKAQYLTSFNNGIATVSSSASFNLYPNPATDITYLTYENKSTGPVSLQLFDLNGRQVSTLVNEDQAIGKQKLAINVAALHLAKGLYFLQLNSNNSLQTIKLSVN